MRILALMMLMVVGCGKNYTKTCYWCKESIKPEAIICKWCGKNPLTPEEKQKILEEKVVGTYEWKDEDGDTYRAVILANGVVEGYINGEKREGEEGKGKWTISKDEELHVLDEGGGTEFLRINKDRFSGVLVSSITSIAKIVEGKRTDYPKDKQITFKKIK